MDNRCLFQLKETLITCTLTPCNLSVHIIIENKRKCLKMKALTVSFVISGLLLGGGIANVVNAGVKTSVVAEYSIGPSYPNFQGSSATLIQRKNHEGKTVELRAIVNSGNKAFLKYFSPKKLDEIQNAINKVKTKQGWKNYAYYYLCDAPAIDISTPQKDLSIISICGPKPEDGTALPEPSQDVLTLKNTLSQIYYTTINSYDAVAEIKP